MSKASVPLFICFAQREAMCPFLLVWPPLGAIFPRNASCERVGRGDVGLKPYAAARPL